MVWGAERRSNVQVLLAHEFLSQSQLSTFLISILGTLKHAIKEHYKMVCLYSLLPSLLSILNLDFQIPDIHSFSKYLLSTFRVPGTVRQILQRAQFLPWLLGLCLFAKVLPLTLLNGYTPTELFLLSFLSFIKDVPGTEDTAVNKIDNSPCGARLKLQKADNKVSKYAF